MGPIVWVYLGLLALLVIGMLAAFLTFRARRRGADTAGQGSVAEPLPKPPRRMTR